MPNLRELLQQHRVEETVSPSKFATWTYNLLEAIVEELEAQRPPQVDARIAALTADRDSWERQCRNAERGLAEAKFTIAENDSREQQCRNVERGLAKAKAEVESLRAELLRNVEGLMANAAIGDLVRKMRIGTRLVCGMGRGSHNAYMTAEMRADRPPNLDPWVWLPGLWADPAEALRSIREGADEQAAEA